MMRLTDIITLIALVAGYNLFVFAAYFTDKRAAKLGHRRISEKTLLMLALAGGSPGAIAAQRLLRHKTQKEPFRTLLLLIAVLHAVVLVGAAALLLTGRLDLG